MTGKATLIKKKMRFSSYLRKFRMGQLQSHIWLTASPYICPFPHILGSPGPSSYMTLQLLHSEFPYIWGKFDFLFYQCTDPLTVIAVYRVWSSPSWPSCRGRSGWGWGRRRDSTPCVQSRPSNVNLNFGFNDHRAHNYLILLKIIEPENVLTCRIDMGCPPPGIDIDCLSQE